MNIHEIPAGSVVVGVDGSEHSNRAVDWAADAAVREQRDLTVLHSQAPAAPWWAAGYGSWAIDPTEITAAANEASLICTRAAAARAQERQPGLTVRQANGDIDPRTALTEASRQAHLVVVGSRGRGAAASVLLGSVGVALVRLAACPTVVVRPGSSSETYVVALVDASSASGPVLEHAATQALALEVPLVVLHAVVPGSESEAVDLGPGRELLSEVAAGLSRRSPGLSVRTSLLTSLEPTALLESVDDAALVVVGHHHDTGARRLLYRSVSLDIIEHAGVPVAVVPCAPHDER